jgi:tetratricopeptide (TPR) repeat protein
MEKPKIMSSFARTFTLVGVLLLSSTVASETPVFAQPTKEEDEKAREMYEEAESHYAAGEYEEAAELFLKAYKLTKYPELLFDLGNCFERMGDYEQAAKYLRRYLKSDEAEDIVSVRRRIKRLEMALKRQDLQDQQAQPNVDKEVTVVPKKKEESGTPKYYWWYGGAGLALASGVGFSLAARSAGSTAEDHCVNGLCSTRGKKYVDRERNFALVADISYGLALVAGTVGLYYQFGNRELETNEPRTVMQPILIPGGIGLGISSEL